MLSQQQLKLLLEFNTECNPEANPPFNSILQLWELQS